LALSNLEPIILINIALNARLPLGRGATIIKGAKEMLSTVLIVILVLLLIGALPAWPYSGSWGYAPGGLLGAILVVVLVLALLGRFNDGIYHSGD
jgi:hypothetical protein